METLRLSNLSITSRNFQNEQSRKLNQNKCGLNFSKPSALKLKQSYPLIKNKKTGTPDPKRIVSKREGKGPYLVSDCRADGGDDPAQQMKEMAAARKRWIREEKVKVLTPREAGYVIQLTNKTLLDVRPSIEHKKVFDCLDGFPRTPTDFIRVCNIWGLSRRSVAQRARRYREKQSRQALSVCPDHVPGSLPAETLDPVPSIMSLDDPGDVDMLNEGDVDMSVLVNTAAFEDAYELETLFSSAVGPASIVASPGTLSSLSLNTSLNGLVSEGMPNMLDQIFQQGADVVILK